MDSKTYQAKVRGLLGTAHDLHQAVAATMTQIGDDGGTAEWQTLYSVMQSVGVACGIMYQILIPRPSALAEMVIVEPAVPMVCTVCRRPVLYAGPLTDEGDGTARSVGAGYWYHEDSDDADDCPRTSDVRAMVAEGNERVPGPADSDADPYSNARLHGEA